MMWSMCSFKVKKYFKKYLKFQQFSKQIYLNEIICLHEKEIKLALHRENINFLYQFHGN